MTLFNHLIEGLFFNRINLLIGFKIRAADIKQLGFFPKKDIIDSTSHVGSQFCDRFLKILKTHIIHFSSHNSPP